MNLEGIQHYIDQQESPFRQVLWDAHDLILGLLPSTEAHIKYSIPFYYYYGPFVYMSVPKKEPCVEVAFVKGKYLEQHPDLSWRPIERKQVKSVAISGKKDLVALRFLIMEAAPLNEARPGWALQKKKGA